MTVCRRSRRRFRNFPRVRTKIEILAPINQLHEGRIIFARITERIVSNASHINKFNRRVRRKEHRFRRSKIRIVRRSRVEILVLH